MLVGIEPREEPPQLGLTELEVAVNVLRVRHALPACQRMRHLEPFAVVVGKEVRSWALPFLQGAARESGAVLLQLGPLVARDALRDWVWRAFEIDQRRRQELASDVEAPAAVEGSR